MYGSIGGPQLVNHNLDDIFDEEPVKLPSRLAGPRRPGNKSHPKIIFFALPKHNNIKIK
jgi:hypothetical protein